MGQIEENLDRVRSRIRDAALRSGRHPEEIRLLAVTKTVSLENIQKVIAAGVNVLGENKVQEFLAKWPQVQGSVHWHIIGTLQTNKVKYIYDKVDLIHSLDRLSLAAEINKYALRISRPVDCLVEVNVAGEESKHGVSEEKLASFLGSVADLEGVRVCGLMTMAPYTTDPQEVRWVFRRLHELSREIATLGLAGVEMNHLSMGMSNDFEVAVEEGATIVRVGSEIFGRRQ